MKKRADLLLALQGLVENQEAAKRCILAGEVFYRREDVFVPVEKPGQQFADQTCFEVRPRYPFVSRAGEKLLTALNFFSLDVTGMVALDGGASTGGFTDCLLQHGAARVYAVDVGYGQLAWKLRQDKRVINFERVNLRHAPPDLLPEQVDLIVLDCSFISLSLVLPPCMTFLRPGGQVIALVKPQFELDASCNVKGVVRDKALQLQAVEKVQDFARENLGLLPVGSVPSSVKGPKGNQEFLVLFQCEEKNTGEK